MIFENLLKPILIAIIEGLTEFIPVSSTGHMIILGKIIAFEGEKAATFEIFIQLGAILAAVFIYKNHFYDLIPKLNEIKNFKKVILSEKKPNLAHIFLAIFPALLMGFLFYSYIKKYLFTPYTVGFGLIIGGVVMIIVDIMKKKFEVTEIEKITYKQALFIGIGQCCALWPGVSRSGSTMITSLILGIKHKVAADFSFIIAVPIMVAAVSYDLLKSWSILSFSDLPIFISGFIVAFIIAWGSIKWFLNILQKVKLIPFGGYRILIGALTIYLSLY